MDSAQKGVPGQEQLAKLLGYLNFSSGTPDPQFLSNANQLYAIWLEKQPPRPANGTSSESVFWRDLHVWLEDRLGQLKLESDTFSDDQQVRDVLRLVRDEVIPGYLEFHRDLLHHQTEASLFGPFLWGCVCQAVLAQGAPWSDSSRIRDGAIDAINDYVGYRPVPALESRKLEPYPHERVRPIPIYVEGAGVMFGRYHDVIERTLKILSETDPALLRAAQLDPTRIAELAIDPRAYDFEHPVNKRPNYQFGMWDPNHIDQQGYYRRFIVQQLTIEALMSRLGNVRNRSADQLLTEAAAVLAGTILMASGISGEGPQGHDSSVSLGDLIQRIAAYRDIFYEQLLHRLEGKHADLLRKEMEQLHQPFGGARQHLNTQLARRRAEQLERVRLANVFAHMGYLESAERLIENVQVPAARMASQMNCLLIDGNQAVRNQDPETALSNLIEIRNLLDRAIACGAVIDPWSILGFDANFSLFPALENSVYDHRADDLIDLMERIFGLYGAAWSDAAAANKKVLAEEISAHYLDICRWWNHFAVHEVSSVQVTPPLESYEASETVAEAMKLWHQGGAEAGDIKFWAPHVAMFDSPKAYAYVVEALLERGDYVSSMSLLVHWLGKAPVIALEDPHGSFHRLAQQWIHQLASVMLELPDATAPQVGDSKPPMERQKAWGLIRKFLDYLEANADDYWNVPVFEMDTVDGSTTGDQELDDDEAGDEQPDEEENSLFHAAYENVVYQDSTDDGIESSLYDPFDVSESNLEEESERVIDRLAFLDTLARLWRTASVAYARTVLEEQSDGHESAIEASESLRQWHRQTAKNVVGLAALRAAVQRYRLAAVSITQEAMIHYDHCRLIKETLLEQIITTALETTDAGRFALSAALATGKPDQILTDESWTSQTNDEDVEVACLLADVLRENRQNTAERVTQLIDGWSRKRILYVPLAKAGDPGDILQSRVRQRALENLLAWLPRLGLLTETRQLIELTREMEHNVAVAGGAVTQFDELFETGYRAIVQCVERTYSTQNTTFEIDDPTPDSRMVHCLERVTEELLLTWLEHSRTLRLSVLEKVRKRDAWQAFQEFIQRYGHGLFTQVFLNLSNIRAILHRGVGIWLDQVAEQEQEEEEKEEQPRLFRELGQRLDRDEAIGQMTLVLEGVVENYGEYREYNGTTTQSDQGEMLYTLFDFLRLKSSYDRIVWNLRPIVLAHDVLVRKGRNEAAQMWRRALTERVGDEADRYVRKLKRLQKKYAMRMPSIADHLGERFLRPMIIDRMRALVEPAVAQRAAGEAESHSFEILEEECMLLMREPAGSGLDVPAWLSALEMEVAQLDSLHLSGPTVDVNELLKPRQAVTAEQIEKQLEQWASGA